MREAVRVCRGVRGFEKERIWGSCVMSAGCVPLRRNVDLGVKAEDGRRRTRRGVAFMLTKWMEIVEGQYVSIDGL